jgi:hypothetical protein
MEDKQVARTNAYRRRIDKEATISEEDIRARMRWDMPILAQNHKCGVSLDLPVSYCQPTATCADVCYASQGRQLYRPAVVKSLAVSRMIEKDPERAARKMVDEAGGRPIRIAGSGDILPSHKVLLDYIEQYDGSWWGFTRRIDTHKTLPRLMFSLDATTRKESVIYTRDCMPRERRAYLRRPADPEPSMDVAVVFPVHGARTNYVDQVPKHPNDCPAVRGKIEGCWQCKRCY